MTNRSGAFPDVSPKATRNARSWGSGIVARWSSMGAHMLEHGEGKFQLRLDTRNLRDLNVGRLPSAVLQQRGLADPRLTANDQRRALIRAERRPTIHRARRARVSVPQGRHLCGHAALYDRRTPGRSDATHAGTVRQLRESPRATGRRENSRKAREGVSAGHRPLRGADRHRREPCARVHNGRGPGFESRIAHPKRGGQISATR